MYIGPRDLEPGSHVPSDRGGRKRAMSPQNCLAFTLFFLRIGLDVKLIEGLFGINKSPASQYLTTWIIFLHGFLAVEFPYPTKDQLKTTTGGDLKEHFDLEGMFLEALTDCHEQEAEVPGDKCAQRAFWSEYQNICTVIFFGAITGNGTFSLPSMGYPARITNSAITKLCMYL